MIYFFILVFIACLMALVLSVNWGVRITVVIIGLLTVWFVWQSYLFLRPTGKSQLNVSCLDENGNSTQDRFGYCD